MEKWELAYQDYLNKMKYKDIAEKYDVSINTVKSWKSRKWNAPPEKKSAHKKEKVGERVNILWINWRSIDEERWWKVSELNPRQQAFADEYIITGNATQSAIKAGYSERYANTNASKLLQNTTIKVYIERKMKEIIQIFIYLSINHILISLKYIFPI